MATLIGPRMPLPGVISRLVEALQRPGRSAPAAGVLSAAQLDRLFEETLGVALAEYGFAPVGGRRWVRSTGAPVREMVCMQALKGALYTPCWGVSLDFVPHVERRGTAVRWHRTPRSARLDLRHDPIDYVYRPDPWDISGTDGMATARRQAARITAKTLEEALPWLQRAVAPNGLLAVFEEQRTLPAIRFAFENYVQHPLAYAFVLARSGDLEAAREQLGSVLAAGWIEAGAAGKLRDLLEAVPGASTG